MTYVVKIVGNGTNGARQWLQSGTSWHFSSGQSNSPVPVLSLAFQIATGPLSQ